MSKIFRCIIVQLERLSKQCASEYREVESDHNEDWLNLSARLDLLVEEYHHLRKE